MRILVELVRGLRLYIVVDPLWHTRLSIHSDAVGPLALPLVPSLLELLSDPDENIRWHAVDSWTTFGNNTIITLDYCLHAPQQPKVDDSTELLFR